MGMGRFSLYRLKKAFAAAARGGQSALERFAYAHAGPDASSRFGWRSLSTSLWLEVTPNVLTIFFGNFGLFDRANFGRRDAAEAAGATLVGSVP